MAFSLFQDERNKSIRAEKSKLISPQESACKKRLFSGHDEHRCNVHKNAANKTRHNG